MKKQTISLFLIIILLVFLSMGCSKSGESQDTTENPGVSAGADVQEDAVIDAIEDPNLHEIDSSNLSGISFPEEADGAKIKRVKADPSDFIGKWTATSDQAVYMYGNVDLIINEGGTWAASITDEKLSGHWSANEDYLHFDDDQDLFDFDLAFDETGTLIMTERTDDGVINTVLTKVN